MKILPVFQIVLLFLISPFSSFGQPEKKHSPRFEQHEEMDDAYMPNAFNNKKLTPAYSYKIARKTNTSNSSIFTTQVNVEIVSGQNIWGDAANEPSITFNPFNPNQITIGWRQFDNVFSNFRQAGWAYSDDAGQTWNYLGIIEPGIFRSDPILDYNSTGNFYYNSMTSVLACKLFLSVDGGMSWDPGTVMGGGDKSWLAIDRTQGIGNGNIYSAWNALYTSCTPGTSFTRSVNNGGSFLPCDTIEGDPSLGTMAIGNNGELYVCGNSVAIDSLQVIKSQNVNIGSAVVVWNTPVPVFMDGNITFGPINPMGIIGQANIDVDRSNGPGRNNVYLCATIARLSNADPGDVMFVKSTDGGVTWSAPIKINDDNAVTNTQWFATMSVAPNGRIDVIWLDTRDDISSGLDYSALYYSYSLDQGTNWSVNEKMSDIFDPHTGYPNQDKIGDYFDMKSVNAGAHLSWAATFNGEEDVYYSFITPATNVSVNEIVEEMLFNIYPNPIHSELNIHCSQTPKKISIINILGEEVYSDTHFNSKNEIQILLPDLSAGIYFVQFKSENGILVKKFVKD